MFHRKEFRSTSIVAGYPVEYWLSDADIAEASHSGYWNDEEIEKRKPWHVIKHGFSDLKAHLEQTGLARQLTQCLDTAARLGQPISGVGADLACGVFWTAPFLFGGHNVEKVYGVEFSKHRLLQIAPSVLSHYGVPPEKVILCLGNFCDLRFPDEYLDFVVLAEAFHHADDPGKLLSEIRRVLKPRGTVLILGEHRVPHKLLIYGGHLLRHVAAKLPEAVQRKFFGRIIDSSALFPCLEELLKPDPLMGDHYYLSGQYDQMFSSHGFDYQRVITPGCPFQGFVLTQAH